MFGFLKRKKKEEVVDCFHQWKLIDIEVSYSDTGYGVDVDNLYVIGCSECRKKQTVDEYRYVKMKHLELVNELRTESEKEDGLQLDPIW